MKFRLAKDVRRELELRARITKRDPNDILRELLGLSRLEKRVDKPLIPAQKFYETPKGERPPWGRVVMKRPRHGA